MKKIFIVLFIFISTWAIANDSTKKAVRFALEQIQQRPVGVTETQAIDLFLNPGKILLLGKDSTFFFDKFSFPFSGAIKLRMAAVSVFHDGSNWKIGSQRTVTTSSGELDFISWMILSYFVGLVLKRLLEQWDSSSFRGEFTELLNEKEKGNAVIRMRATSRIQLHSNQAKLFRSREFWSIGLTLFFSATVSFRKAGLQFIGITFFWFVIAGLLAYVVRRVLVAQDIRWARARLEKF